jgi:hypothetical protein
MHSDTLVISVMVPEGDLFSVKELLKGKLEFDILSGQHITEADKRVLDAIKNKTLQWDSIPETVEFKAVEIYVNLLPEEKSLLVIQLNRRLNLDNTLFDQVRLSALSFVSLFCFSVIFADLFFYIFFLSSKFKFVVFRRF